MNRDVAKRGVMLADALDHVAAMSKAIGNKRKDGRPIGLALGAGVIENQEDDPAVQPDVYLVVDAQTGAEIIEAAHAIIERALKATGVTR